VRISIFTCSLSVLMLMLTPFSLAQRVSTPSAPTIILDGRIRHPVGVPPFSATSNQCDKKENVFFDLTGSTYSLQTILRISANGQDAMPIRVPVDLASNKGEWQFSIDSDGGVYLLFSHVDQHELMHYMSTGEQVSRLSVQLPKYYYTHSFAVLPDKRSMFFGFVPVDEMSATTSQRPLSVWLDSSGKLVRSTQSGREVSLTDPQDGLVTGGRPGTFIEAVNSEIRIFGAQGERLQTFRINKPTADSFATILQVVNGQVAIAFSHSAGTDSAQDALEQTWLLVDPSTGVSDGFYKMPDDFTGSALCYLGQQKFLYMTVKDGANVFIEANQ
jgi:hypothetical protein